VSLESVSETLQYSYSFQRIFLCILSNQVATVMSHLSLNIFVSSNLVVNPMED